MGQFTVATTYKGMKYEIRAFVLTDPSFCLLSKIVAEAMGKIKYIKNYDTVCSGAVVY